MRLSKIYRTTTRDKYKTVGHARTPNTIAGLLSGVACFVEFLMSSKAVNADQAQKIMTEAENAIVQAAYHGVNIKGSTLYSTYSPCLLCTKMIINSGLQEVVFSTEYAIGDIAMKLLKEAGVAIRQYAA